MNSRNLNKKIAVWGADRVSDGFGGYEVEDTLIFTTRAKIETLTNGRLVSEFGISNSNANLKITVRDNGKFNAKNQFIIYRNKKYAFTQAPLNSNFEDKFISFLCTEIP